MTIQAPTTIEDNSILIGKVVRPFIAREQLLGAILSFEGKSETALLHEKQIAGDNPSARLLNLCIGEEVRVKITITVENGVRKVRASEKDVDTDQEIADKLNALPDSSVLTGSVVNVASYGVFVELSGTVKKKRLVHNKNMYSGSGMSLKSFGELVPGKEVFVCLAGKARVDERGTLRIDLAFATKPVETSAA